MTCAGDLGAVTGQGPGLLRSRRELLFVAPAHHDVHALAREGARDRLADAVTGGHYGRTAANEIEIHGRDATRAQAPR